MKSVTLGGDRLGAGKKQKVQLKGYERSTHDLGYVWMSTMSAGTLVPFMFEPTLPGDTFDINLDCDFRTLPTIGPLFGSYKVQLDVFLCPVRLYNAMLHNNTLDIGRDMAKVKLPVIEYTILSQTPGTLNDIDLDNSQINPSCILSYLGLRGFGRDVVGTENPTRQFHALGILMMYDTYKYYYANKQEEIGAVIHTQIEALVETVDTPIIIDTGGVIRNVPLFPTTGNFHLTTNSIIKINFTGAVPIPNQIFFNTVERGWIQLSDLANFETGTDPLQGNYNQNYGLLNVTSWRYRTANDPIVTQPNVVTFPLENIDLVRKAILQKWDTAPLIMNTDANFAPYQYLWETPEGRYNTVASQEGLLIKTYQSDLFNNWIQTEWIDGANGINELTSIDTTSGNFQIPTLILARKVYDMLNRIAVSDGTYDAYMDVQYDHERFQRAESPMYMGGLIKELVFQEVVSNSETEGEGGTQPLGTLAGKGIMGKKHKGGHVTIKVDEISYILGIISLTPRITYSQGNKWDTQLKTIADFHVPALDEIGFQELITEQFAWWSTNWSLTEEWILQSAGKQPAWINYMTNVNQARGNFAIATNQMFMTLNRRYEHDADGILLDVTTYIDPAKFNYVFAQTALDAQNFWCQIAVDITARRKMSAKIMPNL